MNPNNKLQKSQKIFCLKDSIQQIWSIDIKIDELLESQFEIIKRMEQFVLINDIQIKNELAFFALV